MKKQNLVRILCLILMVGLLLPTASAATQAQPRYAKIHTLTSELLSINWLGKATCCGTADSLDSTCRLELFVELQRSEDGVNGWTTIKTWDTVGYSDVAIEGYHYVAAGYYYRVGTSIIVYDAEGYFIESDATLSAVLYH